MICQSEPYPANLIPLLTVTFLFVYLIYSLHSSFLYFSLALSYFRSFHHSLAIFSIISCLISSPREDHAPKGDKILLKVKTSPQINHNQGTTTWSHALSTTNASCEHQDRRGEKPSGHWLSQPPTQVASFQAGYFGAPEPQRPQAGSSRHMLYRESHFSRVVFIDDSTLNRRVFCHT